MRLGDLGRVHRFRRVTYQSGDVSITGKLEFFQAMEHDGLNGVALTIGGWVSHPLGVDEEIKIHADGPDASSGQYRGY